MTYVVTENCINCKFTTCVAVCPTDSFRDAGTFLVIDPEVCIDCALCVTECPANAIYPLHEVPRDQRQFIELNVQLSASSAVVTQRQEPLPGANDWNGQPDKRRLILAALAE